MKPTRKLSRRSFLGRVAGGAIVAGGALTVVSDTAAALQTQRQRQRPQQRSAGRAARGSSCG